MNALMRTAQGLINAAWTVARAPSRLPARLPQEKAHSGTYQVPSGGWRTLIRESFAGAWQRNVEINVDTALTYSAVFACRSLISSDIAKMRLRLVQQDENGIWNEKTVPRFSSVLRKPNHFQTRIQFIENWVDSKLIHGNTYVLKQREGNNVTALYVLDPTMVRTLVAPNGDVFYQLHRDDLARLPHELPFVPASEIIHDRWNTVFHPLVGLSPIYASGMAAAQGINIQQNSAKFFANGSTPGGLLLAPGPISDEMARRLKQEWDEKYGAGGDSVGKVAVLGDGLRYEPMSVSAVDSQLLEQLKWTAETVCSTFKVPLHMIGIGQPPTYNNIEALNQQYYSQTLQRLIEDIEELLNQGLGLGPGFGNAYGAEFDLDDLIRMDSKTQMEVAGTGVQRGIFSPNEGRFRFNMKPVEGGESPYLQEQNWPLKLLSDRAVPGRPVTPPEEIEPDDDGDDGGEEARAFYADEILRRARRLSISS